ncbi:hypothetical protein HP567_027210 [Brevibacillus sp. M2.1A]|uniref:hypothetical protein n=1 Tax=Brevibacillus sp. M2.1A TaxID=2738980 RepID=UPI001E29923B|nr:hypothetical protein [Brevibacillus sp. M2.1A]MCC8438230.1 hypothetical protein [Brevibacillus sp. M2.1A]
MYEALFACLCPKSLGGIIRLCRELSGWLDVAPGNQRNTVAPVPTTPTGTAPAEAEATAPATPTQEATAPAATEKATITKSEFEQIENGMSLEEVKKIVGGEGKLLAEVGKKGEEGHTIVYMYKGEGAIGANANFSFQGGILQVKSQIGLQ